MFNFLGQTSRVSEKNKKRIQKTFRKLLERCSCDKEYANELGLDSVCFEDVYSSWEDYQFLLVNIWPSYYSKKRAKIIAFNPIKQDMYFIPTNKRGTRVTGKCLFLSKKDIKPGSDKKKLFYDADYNRYSIYSDSFELLKNTHGKWFDFGYDHCVKFRVEAVSYRGYPGCYLEQEKEQVAFSKMMKTIYKEYFGMNHLDESFETMLTCSPETKKKCVLRSLEALKPKFEEIFHTPFVSKSSWDILDLLKSVMGYERYVDKKIYEELTETVCKHFDAENYTQETQTRKLVDYFAENLDIDLKTEFILLLICLATWDGNVSFEEEEFIYEYFNKAQDDAEAYVLSVGLIKSL